MDPRGGALVPVEINGVYPTPTGGPLPKRMAWATPDMRAAMYRLRAAVEQRGGSLILSDLYRSGDEQDQAHRLYSIGRKAGYSPPAGQSMHEAGRAMDIDLSRIGMPLADFWRLAAVESIVPIIQRPVSSALEAWHFERRGSHQLVYQYAVRQGIDRPALQMARSAILDINGRIPGLSGSAYDIAYAQSALIRLGYDPGPIDGLMGHRTRAALDKSGLDKGGMFDVVAAVSNAIAAKFTDESVLQNQ